jgi:hypothetical protein
MFLFTYRDVIFNVILYITLGGMSPLHYASDRGLFEVSYLYIYVFMYICIDTKCTYKHIHSFIRDINTVAYRYHF